MTTVDGGRAVVQVVTRASAASLAATGKLIEKKLEESAKRSGDVFERQFDISLGRGAVIFGAITSAASPAASAISAVSGGVVALGASLQQATVASTSFLGVFGSLIQVVTVANTAFNNFGKAVTADTPEKLAEAMKDMAPAAREAVAAMRGLKDEFTTLRQSVQQAVFKDFADNIEKVAGTLLPVLQTNMTQTGYVMNLLFNDLTKFTTSASFVERFNTVLANNNDVFDRLRMAVVPFLDGLLNIFVALGPSAERLATSIGKLAVRFQEWTSQAGFAERIDGIMRRAQETAGLLLRTIGNLAQALGAVFTAAGPAGNQFLTMLNNLFIRFEAFARSTSGKAQIAAWAEQGVESMRELGHSLALLGPVFTALADPAVFSSLLRVFDEWAQTMALLAPLLSSTAKALGFFAPILGPAIALSGVFFAFTLQAKILGGVLKSLGLANLALGFLNAEKAASKTTGIMGSLGGKIAQSFDGVRLRAGIFTFADALAFVQLRAAAFGKFIIGAFIKIGTVLRTVFLTNPVGLIITGLVLLGVALFALYQKSETFRNAVNAVWGAIQAAAAATVAWFTSTALPALQAVWDGIMAGASAVGGFFAMLWGGLVIGFQAVWGFIMMAWTAVGVPIFTLIQGYISLWVAAIQIVWTLLQVAWALLWFGITTVWNTIGVPLIALIQMAWGIFVATLALVWAALQVAWGLLWTAITAVWNAIGVPLIALIQAGWSVFVAALAAIWAAITVAWDAVWAAVVAVWEAVGVPLFDAIMVVWDNLVAAAETITGAIGDFFVGMWDGVVEAASGALGALIKLMNSVINGVNAIVNGTNAITGSNIGTIDPIPTPQLATGARNFRGGVALVGEEGPELVNLPRGSDVIPNGRTNELLGGNGMTFIINQTNTGGPGSDLKDIEWIIRHGVGHAVLGNIAELRLA